MLHETTRDDVMMHNEHSIDELSNESLAHKNWRADGSNVP